EPIIQRGDTRGFSVVLSGPVGDHGNRIADGGSEFTPGLDTSSVPASLEAHFDTIASSAWTYTTIRTTDASGVHASPGVVVGSQVKLPSDGETYTLYYLFPLDEQEETLALVTRALLTAGILLLVLVAGLAWLVTRQVVTPIRLARRVAERLAAGQRPERLRVTGEDDLARLATSFNQMASNLQRQIRQLEELSRLQRRFVSDVSHELRTPLTTVRMAGDVLHDARADFDPVTARAAELLQVELDRFETLLADLLEISRFDAGAAVLDADDVNLVDVAHRVVDMTRALAAQRDVRIEVRAPDHPCLAEADVRRVERIVRNLVTNAIDHADATGMQPGIVILVEGDDHAAAIAVRDYGVGLAPGESAMVFNRFWRADPARARTSGGTGLGLSISLEDTHLHGGWLQAWGRPGQGAQFRLTLPRRAKGALRHSPLPLVPADAEEVVS
ncbi:MAG: MtrAB system histidine kinase MtrB, partial [Nocardioides sp.]